MSHAKDARIGQDLLRFVPLSTGPIDHFPKVPVNPSDFIHSKDALVGVFDFLGFTEIMSNQDLFDKASTISGISDIVRSCGEDIKKRFEVNGKISDLSPELIQISDTFVVYNISREPSNVKHFLWNAHEMMFHAILSGFPLRGALTTGEILIRKDGRLFLGGALQEAFKLEKLQMWSGACIGLSLQQYIDRIGLTEALFPQILTYPIPFRHNAPEKAEDMPQMALNWIDEFNWIFPDFIYSKFPTFRPGSDEEQKAINTQKFLEFAFDQIPKCAHNWGPSNRKISLYSAPDLGGSIIRLSYGDEAETR
jgi:hypothetical protein